MATNMVKFPDDLDENPEHHHFLVFRIFSNSSASLGGSSQSSSASTSSSSPENALLKKLDSSRGQKPEYSGTAKTTDLSLENAGGQLKEGFFSDTTYSRAKKINQDAIYLPFPQTISMTDAWSWESVTFQKSAIGEMMKGDVSEGLQKMFTETVGGIGKFAGENVDRLMMHSQRKASNPRKETLFNEPEMRKFSFEFAMNPRNEKESATAQKIIQLLKYHGSPELYKGDNALYVYPSEFQIYFVSNGKENEYIGKMDRCALQSVAVNYTNANMWSAFKDTGSPTHMNLTLEFTELSLQSRNSLKKMDGE